MPLHGPDFIDGARRIHIVGTSGSGKTWLGERLAEKIGAPFIDLDAIHHQADWVPLPEDQFVARVADFAATDAWVTAGNYSRARPVLWPRVDAIVWLDLPRRVVFPAVLGRTIKRAITREELWNGNREIWTNMFRPLPADNVVLWSWTTFTAKRREYLAASVNPANHVVRLGSRREMRDVLASL